MDLSKSRQTMVMLGMVCCCLLALGVVTGISSAANPATASPAILYVKPGATGNCSGWDNACTLQTALGLAGAGDEIWVAEGTHKPTTGTERTATFQLKSGVKMYGGFDGLPGTEGAFSQRDWETNITVLSGDIDDNDITDPNGVITTTTNITGTNSYHVVTGSGTDASAVLDGFTVTGGNADESFPDPRSQGGGMYNDGGSPTLTNVTFSGNFAKAGGGMYNDGGSPTLTNATFTGNSAEGAGGGMSNWDGSPTLTNVTFVGNSADQECGGGMTSILGNPTLTNVAFTDNSSGSYGGGMCIGSSATLTNVTFSGNSADYGGGISNEFSNPTLANVTFSGNSSDYNGGGMYNWNSNPALTNVTFAGNSAAANGGGIYNEDNSNPTLTNSILWGNAASSGAEIYNDNSTPTVSYSLVEGGCPSGSTCDHILDADPQFVDAPNGDLHLQDTSPAIDAGDNTAVPPDTLDLDGDGNTTEKLPFDLDGDPRILCIVDMGAYEAKETTVCT